MSWVMTKLLSYRSGTVSDSFSNCFYLLHGFFPWLGADHTVGTPTLFIHFLELSHSGLKKFGRGKGYVPLSIK